MTLNYFTYFNIKGNQKYAYYISPSIQALN